MSSGQATLLDEPLVVLLKKVSKELDSMTGVDGKVVADKVRDAIDAVYKAKTPIIKSNFAKQWSEPDMLVKVNAERANKGLPSVTSVDSQRVAIQNDPANSTDPKDYDLVIDLSLFVIVASYFGDVPSATEFYWPGARTSDILAKNGEASRHGGARAELLSVA